MSIMSAQAVDTLNASISRRNLLRRSVTPLVAATAMMTLPAAALFQAEPAPALTGDALFDRYLTWLHHERVAAFAARDGADMPAPLSWPGNDRVAENFVKNGGDLSERAARVLAAINLHT